MWRSRSEAEPDRAVAVVLMSMALMEIRATAGAHRRDRGNADPEKDLDHIRFLANLCDNLPIGRAGRRRPTRIGQRPSAYDRAMAVRPMTWAWHTTGPEGQAWMLRKLRNLDWTPPPPIPKDEKGPLPLTLRQRAGVLLGRWPVRAPAGLAPLPPEANVLKALDTAAVGAVFEEAGRRRLGLGTGGPWLSELDPDATHYLWPDPASYYWPGPATWDWWECGVLLTMRDGTVDRSGVAVMPETFTALPSTVPRRRQIWLVHHARSI